MCQLNILDYSKVTGGCGHLWVEGVEQCSEAEAKATRCKLLCEDLTRKAIVPKTPLFRKVKNFLKGGVSKSGRCPSCVKGVTIPVPGSQRV
ncbi:uncharacterized protein N7484_001085 [Penicillium longicatenatum]|uniref:uncharacterized protein n=1 Tax=Penicillium longicatenatum TaxID=1561947 RepID=UPI002547E2A9|nr:uncharacterized protein N7484_001085 [Penicillium longicatenatum]KAJ5657436.1 hypothetical protein N7484_001085 [Penicillium longicatenatum]